MRHRALVIALALVAAPLPGRTSAAAPYTVRPGDSLYSIARALGTTVDELQRLNGSGGLQLRAGQTIVVPDAPPVEARRHTVASGENLYRIAARYGITVPALQAANRLVGDALRVGQVLLVPAGATPPQTISTAQDPGPPSDPLDGLPAPGEAPAPPPPSRAPEPARAEAAPPIGQLLPLPESAALPDLAPASPAPPADGAPALLHTVAARETLFGIGRRYGVDLELVRSLNGLTGDAIAVGQVLRLPIGGARPAEPAAAGVRELAERFLGVPYLYGGTTPGGVDCSGFTGLVMAELGLTLPRTSLEQFAFGKPVVRADLREGDLVFFDTTGSGSVSHVGIYLGNLQFIHAASSIGKVIVSRLDEPYYADRYLGARRALGARPGEN